MKTIIITLLLLASVQAHALDRLAALSQIETNDRDYLQTPDVSRFGISPPVWAEYTELPLSAASNPFTASNVVVAVMRDRTEHFRQTHGRAPSDFEYFVLWHKPATIDHPSAKTAEMANRFKNLCEIK